jgi:hypothetical protein
VTKLTVCAHGRISLPFNTDAAMTTNPRVNELLARPFADRERCSECVRARLRILLTKVRRNLLPVA